MATQNRGIATHSNTLPQTTTRCHTLQHTSTHCTSTTGCTPSEISNTQLHTATHCNTLQHTATHCYTQQHSATRCNTLQHAATHCIRLPHTATRYNTLSKYYLLHTFGKLRQGGDGSQMRRLARQFQRHLIVCIHMCKSTLHCSVLQCVFLRCSKTEAMVPRCGASRANFCTTCTVCCSVLQCIAACRSAIHFHLSCGASRANFCAT